MTKEEFINELKKINIEITKEQLNSLDKYYNLLIEKNKVMNLTAITKEEDVYLKHFYDSLTLIKAIDLNKDLSLCDLGTGAGFPGIVLKIIFPNLKITLVDSLEKRIKFLNEVIEILNLENIKTYHKRIEEFSKENKELYDVVVSRAVAKTNVLLELGCQLVKVNGFMILMKAEIEAEIKQSENAIKTLNYTLENIVSFTLPKEESKRNIIILKKLKSTNNKYPREFGKIKKMPL